MLASKIMVFGKTIPVWVAALALLAATSGAAVGMVLAGSVKGDIVTSLTQALLVHSVDSDKTAEFNAVSDDGTKFTTAVEMQTGDKVAVSVAAINRSTDAIAVLLRLDMLAGVTGEVDGQNDAAATPPGTTTSTDITTGGDSCARINLTDWKCKLRSNTPSGSITPDNTAADFKITLGLNDEVPPGFYTTTVTMTQIENKN